MLVLTRKKGESIVVGDKIEIKVIDVEGDTIKVGIEAPQHIPIHRKEIYEAIQKENRSALQLELDLSEIKNMPK